MANGVSTEWDDIQRKLGNFEQKPYVPTQQELNLAAQEKLLENNEDSDDMDADFEDDDFMKEY